MLCPRVTSGCVLLLLSAIITAAQNTPTSDPQALSLAAQSITALTQGTLVSDVTLTGNVAWTVGSDHETGTATLKAKGTSESRMDLSLTGGQRREVRNGTSGTPLGNWYGPDGAVHKSADQNCWTDAAWFFPALTSLALPPGSNVVLTYVGQETRRGSSVQHLQSYVYAVGQSPQTIAYVQQMSTMDFYLDASSLLPVAISFSAHPDDGAVVNIPVEIDYSSYQTVNGLLVPLHLRKFLQGTLLLDLTITGAAFNSGLPDSTFAIH